MIRNTQINMPGLSQGICRSNWKSFLERFSEHKSAFKTNKHTSNYAKHILEKSHSFCPIHNTMEILQIHGKGTHLNTIEQYYVSAEFTKNNHLNDEHDIFPNKIFDALLEPTSHKHPTQ